MRIYKNNYEDKIVINIETNFDYEKFKVCIQIYTI